MADKGAERDGSADKGGDAGAHDEAHPSTRSERGLDWLNFFVADVQTSFGPFVALYLTAQGWSQGRIGLALTVGTLVGIASQAPGGALVDEVRAKRVLLGASLILIAVGALIFAFFPSFLFVMVAEVVHGSTGGVTKPALAAIGLGLVGHRALSRRLGRNHRYDSFGNALTAGLMGVLGHFVSKRATFLAAAALCAPALFALSRINGDEIDYARARQAAPGSDKEPKKARFRDLLKNRRLLIFAGCLALFQFANASVMPLTSERLAAKAQSESELVTAALVIVPQVVTALIAAWIARRADDWGRKPLLLLGFAALPARAVLFTFAPNPWYLLPIQSLGGLTAAVIGILTPLVIADVTRGTGRYNIAQGTVGIASGIGASLSTVISGYVVQMLGYTIGLYGLGAVGLAGMGLLWWQMPETRHEALPETAGKTDVGGAWLRPLHGSR
ncbi:MAG: MFS transporter [Acetobacteraceae bacterium]|nr:MFS transporter [Acetobacteraceae bacterium]